MRIREDSSNALPQTYTYLRQSRTNRRSSSLLRCTLRRSPSDRNTRRSRTNPRTSLRSHMNRRNIRNMRSTSSMVMAVEAERILRIPRDM